MSLQLVYSQTIYPKEITLNGDTVVAITLDQSREVNKAFLDARHYKIVSDSLSKKVIFLNSRIENDSIIIGDQKFQIDNLGIIMYNKQLVTDKLEEDLEDTDRELEKEKSQNKVVKKVAIGSLCLNVLFFFAMMISR